MKKYDKEVMQSLLDDEKKVLKDLSTNYTKALAGIKEKIKVLTADAEATQLQSKIYQLKYQQALEKQISGYLKVLESCNAQTVQDYLQKCYSDSFVGNVYSLQMQDVPLLFPVDQTQMIQSVMKQTDGYTFSKRLYDNVSELQKIVKSEITRGIASSLSYSDIARNISSYGESSMKNAYRIARTEGHRIQNEAKMDSMQSAKDRGAKIAKQWDSTLDGKTREEHAALDGQIKEINENFTIGSYSAPCPGSFGDPYMDCNCRCTVLQRARWALDGDGGTKHLGDTSGMTDAQLKPIADRLNIPTDTLRNYGNQIIPMKAKSFTDFKQQYDELVSVPNGTAVNSFAIKV